MFLSLISDCISFLFIDTLYTFIFITEDWKGETKKERQRDKEGKWNDDKNN